VLKERETSAHDVGLSSPANGEGDLGDMPPSQTIPKPAKPGAAPQRLDKRQIEQRIEEDRERHKRLRESIWAIPTLAHAERDKLWEETSDLGEDDHIMGEEELEERERAWLQSCTHQKTASDHNHGSSHAPNGKKAR
jgi:CTD kinase subunit gamma